MSKFWTTDFSDDDFSGDIYGSDSGFDSYDSDFDEPTQSVVEQEEEKEKLSGVEKKYHELQTSIRTIKNKINNEDWNAIVAEWPEFTKRNEKLKTTYAKHGIPSFLVIFIATLEDAINARMSKSDLKKKLSKEKIKAINHIKKLLKKWMDGRNDVIEKLAKYRENPESFKEEEEKFVKTVDKSSSKKKPSQQLTGRAKWVKQPGYESSSSDDDDDDDDFFDDDVEDSKSKTESKNRASKKKRDLSDDEETETETTEEKEVWTLDKIEKKTKELLDRRGTKNYDRLEQVRMFELLLEKSRELKAPPTHQLRLSFHLINAQFDASPNMAVHMTIPMWKRCYNNIVRVLEDMKKYKNKIKFVDHEPDPESEVVEVRCPLVSQIERLHEEFMKSLQSMDEYTQDYVNRLKHESALLKLTKAVFDFYVEMKDAGKVAILASRRLDHLYYKREQNIVKSEEPKAAEAEGEPKPAEKESEDKKDKESILDTPSQDDEDALIIPNVPEDGNLLKLVPELCSIIYKTPEDAFPDVRLSRLLKMKAVLQHCYHLALHDFYYEARDLMLMTRMYDVVSNISDPSPKILYNRALVQIGLAAFRKGLFTETQIHLAEFMSTNKYREWLAQGVYKSSEKTPEEERLERLRQVPYPMFINLDLLEFAHLTSSMLHDVTNIFLNDSDKKKTGGSKGYKKILDQAEKNLSGPPESIRENIIAATNALKTGDWKRSSQYLLNLDVWKLIHNADYVKSLLEERIKEESLRAYLLTNVNYYVSISLNMLASMFELSEVKTHSIICKMIINGELSAYWDESIGCYVTKTVEVSYMSQLIKQMADCVGTSEGLRGNLKDKEITTGKKMRR